MELTAADIAQLVGGTVRGDASVRISGVNGIREAQPGDLTFVRGERYAKYLETTRASAVLMERAPAECGPTVIEVAHPDLAFAQVLGRFEAAQTAHPTGISPLAFLGEGVHLDGKVAIAAHASVASGVVLEDGVVLYSGVYVGAGARIGAGTVIYPNAIVREGCVIGARCIIHSGAAIGSDGFGFAPLGGRWMKIPQVGRVVLGDDVEVGSNSCIDRATFGETRIGQGTKIDNLVQIGHNVEIGEHCVVAGAVGIAGSTIIGNHVRIGALSGINGHIDIGDGATVAARSGVTKSVPAGAVVSGFPAIDHMVERKVMVAQQRVPELLRRVRHLERCIEAMEKKLHEQAENDSE